MRSSAVTSGTWVGVVLPITHYDVLSVWCEPEPGVKAPHPECSTGTVLGRGGRLWTLAGSCLSQPLHRCGGKNGRVRAAQNSRISVRRECATTRHVCLVLTHCTVGSLNI